MTGYVLCEEDMDRCAKGGGSHLISATTQAVFHTAELDY